MTELPDAEISENECRSAAKTISRYWDISTLREKLSAGYLGVAYGETVYEKGCAWRPTADGQVREDVVAFYKDEKDSKEPICVLIKRHINGPEVGETREVQTGDTYSKRRYKRLLRKSYIHVAPKVSLEKVVGMLEEDALNRIHDAAVEIRNFDDPGVPEVED